MALQKDVKQHDGITTNYHRICNIQSKINSTIFIDVLSYVNKESRDTETEYYHPYFKEKRYTTKYKENMTIEEAYAYLKTLPEFEDSTDV